MTEVQRFHEGCFLRIELKPDNILVGAGFEADKLFLIDVKLAARDQDPTTQEHIQYAVIIVFAGNPIFASNVEILDKKCSRRDDITSHCLHACLLSARLIALDDHLKNLNKSSKAMGQPCQDLQACVHSRGVVQQTAHSHDEPDGTCYVPAMPR